MADLKQLDDPPDLGGTAETPYAPERKPSLVGVWLIGLLVIGALLAYVAFDRPTGDPAPRGGPAVRGPS